MNADSSKVNDVRKNKVMVTYLSLENVILVLMKELILGIFTCNRAANLIGFLHQLSDSRIRKHMTALADDSRKKESKDENR